MRKTPGGAGTSDDDEPQPATEERIVQVSLVGVSDFANQQLTSELREAVGKDSVRVPSRRAHLENTQPSRGPAWINDGRFLFHIVLPMAAVLGVVVAVAVFAGATLWLLVVATAVLLFATYNVTAFIYRLTGQSDEPSPDTVALLEEEGVRDPEQLFSDLVDEFIEDDGKSKQ